MTRPTWSRTLPIIAKAAERRPAPRRGTGGRKMGACRSMQALFSYCERAHRRRLLAARVGRCDQAGRPHQEVPNVPRAARHPRTVNASAARRIETAHAGSVGGLARHVLDRRVDPAPAVSGNVTFHRARPPSLLVSNRARPAPTPARSTDRPRRSSNRRPEIASSVVQPTALAGMEIVASLDPVAALAIPWLVVRRLDRTRSTPVRTVSTTCVLPMLRLPGVRVGAFASLAACSAASAEATRARARRRKTCRLRSPRGASCGAEPAARRRDDAHPRSGLCPQRSPIQVRPELLGPIEHRWSARTTGRLTLDHDVRGYHNDHIWNYRPAELDRWAAKIPVVGVAMALRSRGTAPTSSAGPSVFRSGSLFSALVRSDLEPRPPALAPPGPLRLLPPRPPAAAARRAREMPGVRADQPTPTGTTST